MTEVKRSPPSTGSGIKEPLLEESPNKVAQAKNDQPLKDAKQIKIDFRSTAKDVISLTMNPVIASFFH